MSLKIRMKRMGKRNTPFYRLVVVDTRWKRDGKTISDIGWYDPVKKPAQVSLKEMEIYQWLEKGAQMSDTARSLLKKQGIVERFRNGAYKELLAKSATAVTAIEKPADAVSSASPEVESSPASE